ncbi:hypothetical protein KY290_009027 [Solanum tuberosum]|uniref:ADP-ribosyl cyclase/cyclic ADP-ribose hydrolase n=1 Tax=Solanum tuberosum TaxID=4113 RepID=A0ABQ7WBJ0_SOLTU|nr:hypothetical protein KY290_009027 [Solanum tuberosum]
MASSSFFASDSQYCPRWKYDVFLSFRGADTRRTFTGHLYEGLKSRGIFTFLDDKRLEDGDSISEELLKAIEESQVALIVFSRNYATSRCCLNEIVKIMECKGEENGQTVIPILYDVDPSHVRYQSDSFAEAFAKHESRYKDDVEGMQKVQGWRTALTAAANLKGYDIRDGIESEKIQQIIDYISLKFCKSARIWGIGGVGKTTIAKAIFDTLSHQFQAACFLADVKENARKNQLYSLQNTLLSELLRKKSDYVNNKYDGKCVIPNRLSSMKVLNVLDGIDERDHLEYLAGGVGWFGNGSRVIITTRNRQLIEKDAAIYEVPTLPDDDAMQLFNQHAFKKEVPDECFKKFSLEVVNHAKGLPLALKVWGSLMHKKGLTQWTRTIDQIKKKPNSEIVEKLIISYDGLEPEEQKIFLDVACFFRGDDREEVMRIVESYESGPEFILDVLIDKSLVFIDYGAIEMHDLIEDMGKYIVKMQKDSGKPPSRILNVEDFEDVMMDNMLLPENFNPRRLVELDLQWSSLHYLRNETKQQFQSLRGINLSGSKSLKRTPDFEGMPNLVYLDLCGCSSLEEVHHSLKYCKNLIELYLCECESLERFPYVNVESLKSLDLRSCFSLEKFPEIHGRMKPELEIMVSFSGIRELPLSFFDLQPHLTELHLSGMDNLVSLPSSICKLKGLVRLYVSECSKLESLPEEIGELENLEELHASWTLISQPPSSIVRLNKLKLLAFANVKSEDRGTFVFPPVSEGLLSLKELHVCWCNLKNLEELDARRTLISRPLSSIVQLNRVKSLTFERDKSEDRANFVFPPVSEGLRSLEDLDLSYCNLIDGGLPEDIGSLSSLKELHLSGNKFEHFPRSIAQLGALEYLDLSNCKRLTQLPEDIGCLSSLKELNLSGNKFEHLPRSIAQLGALQYLDLSDCKRLTQLPEFPLQLDTIYADDSICNSLFQNILSLQHDISVSDSLSLRVFTSWAQNIPSWFHHQGMDTSVSVALPENWCVSDKLLGFVVCYFGKLIDCITAQLIPLCDDGMSSMTQKLSFSNHSEYLPAFAINFFLIPLADLWDSCNANGKTPNDYGCISLIFGEEKKFGVRLLYEPDLFIGIRRRRYEEEATCSSSKKQRQLLQLFPTSPGL